MSFPCVTSLLFLLRSIGGPDRADYFVPKLSFAMVGRKGLATPARERVHINLEGPAIARGVICGTLVVVHSSCARGGMAWFAVPGHFRPGVAMYEHELTASHWQHRGLNVLVLDPTTAVPTAAATFDTHGDRTAAGEFVDFIAEVPDGCPVLVAAHDEASHSLTTAVYTALQSIGGTGADLEFRHSFALVGRKGMVPGDAAETPAAGVDQVAKAQPQDRGIVRVGSHAGSCPKVVGLPSAGLRVSNTPVNHQRPDWNDSFRVEVEGNLLKVFRVDAPNQGWGQSLELGHEVDPLAAAEEPENSPDPVPRWNGGDLVGPKHVGAHPAAATATVAPGVQARAVSSGYHMICNVGSDTRFQIVNEHEGLVPCGLAAAAAPAPTASAALAPAESSTALPPDTTQLLSGLPLEGIAIIAEHLDMDDVLALRMTSQVFRAMIPPPITIQPVQLWGFRGMPPDIAQVDGGWAGFDARDGQSNEPFAKVALTPELLGRGIICIGFKVTWRDQGWGYRKGGIWLTTLGTINWSLFPTAPHALTTVKSTLVWSDEMVTDGEPGGDALKFHAHIGGGGGHSLRIDAFSIAVINRF